MSMSMVNFRFGGLHDCSLYLVEDMDFKNLKRQDIFTVNTMKIKQCV
jgi:hypothetical protein